MNKNIVWSTRIDLTSSTKNRKRNQFEKEFPNWLQSTSTVGLFVFWHIVHRDRERERAKQSTFRRVVHNKFLSLYLHTECNNSYFFFKFSIALSFRWIWFCCCRFCWCCFISASLNTFHTIRSHKQKKNTHASTTQLIFPQFTQNALTVHWNTNYFDHNCHSIKQYTYTFGKYINDETKCLFDFIGDFCLHICSVRRSEIRLAELL